MVEHAPEGKKFVIAEVEIENIGACSILVGSTEMSAADSEGYRCDPELYAGEDID